MNLPQFAEDSSISEDHQSSESRKARGRDGGSNQSASVAWSRDEMNLAEFPLAVLSTRVNHNIKTLEFTDTHRAPSGELVERRWIITGADKFGLPTSTDDDVVLGLMRLSMSKGFRERKVYFTRYELLKTLRWSTEGRSYQRLIKSLDRLSGVRIRSSNSFYDNSSKAYQTCNFGIIDAYEINDGRKHPGGEGELPKSYFIWSERIFDSFKAGYIKKLNLDLYFQLNSAVARRLYRYLDKHFYYKSSIERVLMPFAFEKVGLSRSYKYVSSIKQQLEPGLEELKNVGFLRGYEFTGRGSAAKIRFFAGNGNGAAAATSTGSSVAPTPGPTPQPAQQVDAALTPAASREQSFGNIASARNRFVTGEHATSHPLVQKLVERGMASPQAHRLIAKQPTARYSQIERIICYYDHLVAQQDYKVSKNKVGFLYRAVERSDEFVLPKEFSGDVATPRKRSNRPELKLFKSSRRGE